MNIKKFRKKMILIFSLIFIYFYTCNIAYADTIPENNPRLYCNNNILMDAESGNILYEKNGYAKIYPASTTKVLTAILVLENLPLDEKIVASKNAINSVPLESSVMGIKKEEIFSVENLLYGLLLSSGNDAAIVLAESVSGNVNDFVTLMNTKAKEIGCLNTHFSNPHGFYDDNHYSTPYDMALILKYAMKFDEFKKIVESKSFELPSTNKTPNTRTIKNTNKLIDENSNTFYKYALGGKTGYTIESRGTYIGYSKNGDKILIVGNFDGSQNINGKNARFLDAISLCDYGFFNFNKEKIVTKDTFNFSFIDKNTNTKSSISLKDDIYSLTRKNNYITITPTLNLSDTNNIKINLKIKGNNLDINNTYDSICSSSKYFSLKNILSENFSYIILSILIIILYILIKKLRINNKKIKNKYNNRTKVK